MLRAKGFEMLLGASTAPDALGNSYGGLFETTAAVSGAFFVACLIVAQITVDRAERARIARAQSMNDRGATVTPPTSYHAELLFAALSVAILEFSAMLASFVGLLPQHEAHAHADAVRTIVLGQLGVCAYVVPLFVFLDARSRRTALANLTKAVQVHDATGILYGLTAALTFVVLAGGIASATDFAWAKGGGDEEWLAWTSVFLIVSGGIAMALSMVVYFLIRPFEAADQPEPDRGVNSAPNAARAAVLPVATFLWFTAVSLTIGAIWTFSIAFYFASKWVIVAAAVCGIVATWRSTPFRRVPKLVLVVLLALVAALNNPFFPVPWKTHDAWVIPDFSSAIILFAAGLLLATGAWPGVHPTLAAPSATKVTTP